MANTKQLTTMLKQLGWGSGFRLPISNEENRKLEQMLEIKQSRLVNMSLELQEVSLAVDNSTSFMKNLKSKLKHAKDVEAAKRSQMEKEKLILGLTERDHAKTEQEVKKMEKNTRDLKERNKLLEESVIRRKNALGELVDVINFDKKAISAYEEKFSKEDVYMKLIEDFADTDNERLKKCRDEYQQLGEKVANAKVYLNQTLSDTEILEGELEELAKRFRKAHDERNQFIENWKKTLDVLEDRDKEIMDISSDYQEAALELKKKTSMLERQEAFFENVQIQTKCYENDVNRLERLMGMIYRRKKDVESQVNDNSDAVSELIGCISLTDKEMKTLQNQLRDMADGDNKWKDKMEALKEELESLKAKYDVVSIESLTSTEQTNQLEDFLEKEEKKVEALTRELSKQTGFKSQREMQIQDIAEEVVLVESKGKNIQAAITRTKKKCAETADHLFKTKAVSYRTDLKVISLELKVAGLENPENLYSKEEYEKTQRQIAALKKSLEEQVMTQTQIKLQIGHCDRVTVVCQKELQKEVEQNERFENNLHTLETEIKRIGKDGELCFENIKDVGVDNSLLQVQLSRMVQSIKGYESKMYDLEQQRISIKMAVKERKKDIEIYTSLLLNKKRALHDESQKLRLKCHEVSNDVESKKRRYEMVMGQLWVKSDSDEGMENESQKEGETRSEAYYIIKLAQERERYRLEGDKWDERVKEAENIVEGLQNTLALMIGTNEAFKDSLKPATENTDEGQQLKDLKQKELEAVRNVKVLKDERDRCTRQLRQMQFELDKLVSHRAEFEHQIMEKQYELQGIIIEINGQKEKIQRATQQANKLVRELSKLETLDAELLQNDLRLRVTKEKYEFAVLTLEKHLQMNPNIVGDTLEFLNEKGMERLVGRITRKLISPSLASSPHQSGRSTPYTSRSIGTVPSLKSNKSFVRIHPSRSTMGHSQSQSIQAFHRRSIGSTQRSVVFETLTSAPSAKQMLENISKGLEAHRRATTANLTPGNSVTSINQDVGGISFGELRKALQIAAAEQRGTKSKTGTKQKNEAGATAGPGTVGPKRSIMNVEESKVDLLVDQREEFDEHTTRDE